MSSAALLFGLARPSEFGPPSDDFCDQCLGAMHHLYFRNLPVELKTALSATVLSSVQAEDARRVRQI